MSVTDGTYGRTEVTIAGYRTVSVTALARLILRDGRTKALSPLNYGGRGEPSIIFDIPAKDIDIEHTTVTMSLNDFIQLARKAA